MLQKNRVYYYRCSSCSYEGSGVHGCACVFKMPWDEEKSVILCFMAGSLPFCIPWAAGARAGGRLLVLPPLPSVKARAWASESFGALPKSLSLQTSALVLTSEP